jgi:hypothetical protein
MSAAILCLKSPAPSIVPNRPTYHGDICKWPAQFTSPHFQTSRGTYAIDVLPDLIKGRIRIAVPIACPPVTRTPGKDVCAFSRGLLDPSKKANERDGVVLFVLHTHA